MFLTKKSNKYRWFLKYLEMVSFEHVDFWSENHLLNPTTELTLLCINSIETLELWYSSQNAYFSAYVYY